jgi:hypothetical protein
MHSESNRFEKPKQVIEIVIDTEDGLAKWKAKYDDGSEDSTWQDAEGLRSDSGPEAVQNFKKEKFKELGGEDIEKAA